MATIYNNDGSVARAENMGDVTFNVTYNIPVSSAVQPTEISFKPIAEPHASFIGRDKYVHSSIEYLSQPVAADTQIQFPCLVIYALGGYGKTQTARRIASVCKKQGKFQHVIWIDSEDDISIKKCFVAVCKQVGLASAVDSLQFDLLVHQFYDLLLSRINEKFLIIFDNIEHFDRILKYLPLSYRASNIAVLMTSHRRFTPTGYGKAENSRLDLMLEEEAIQLVEHILGKSGIDSENDKKLLVDRSGRIVLVLCVMTSTIKFHRKYKSGYKIKDYLEKIIYQPYQPIQYNDELNALNLDYEKSLETIVRFVVNNLNAIGGPIEKFAVQIFDRVAYCSSTNKLTTDFIEKYLRDILKEVNTIDMKLPMKPVDNLQITRMAIEKLSEFSLVELSNDVFAVHRWIQASRRLDLKYSGDERNILRELLFIVPDMGKDEENTSIIWQHVADYNDLVNEFYEKKRTLTEFPLDNIDVIEKIIGGLIQTSELDQIENYSEKFDYIIDHLIKFSSIEAVSRIVNTFNYDVKKKSRELISMAISNRKLDLIKSLIEEKSCTPEECHLRECFTCTEIRMVIPHFLKALKPFIDLGDIIKKNRGKNLLECLFNYAFNRLESIGQNPRDLFRSVLKKLELRSMYRTSQCIESFEIFRVILCAFKKTESTDIMEKYSERNLLECLFICGRPHCEHDLENISLENGELEKWSDLHWAAAKNDLNVINSTDPKLIESKTIDEMTPLICAVKAKKCEAASLLLEKYSANVNTMDKYGCTPLIYAIENYCPSIVKILLSHGARTYWTKSEKEKSFYALHEAVKLCRNYSTSEMEQLVKALLESKDCDLNATDLNGNNVLHMLVEFYYATRYKPNHQVLQLLLSANVTLVDKRNHDGRTPLQLAKIFKATFTNDHWHANSLKSIILELEKFRNRDNISDVPRTSELRPLHFLNEEHATKIDNANTIVSSTVSPGSPAVILFTPIPEPHGAFIGRAKFVNSAIKFLSHPVATDCQHQFPCLVMHALGGYGKTQTARKIALVCREQNKFQHVIWIDSEDDLSIRKCFVAVRKQVGLASSDETFKSSDFDSLVHQFYDILLSKINDKFLIIFDNIEHFDRILKYLPLSCSASNIAVLMTSRRRFTQHTYGNVKNQRLGLMLEEEAVQLVEHILGKSGIDSENDKKLLVDRSGRIVLVLCVMTSTIKYQRKYWSDYSIKYYLNYLKKLDDEIIQFGDEYNVLKLDYKKSLQTIVRFAVSKLNEIGGPIEKNAVKCFNCLAYCSSPHKLTIDFIESYLPHIWEAENVDVKLQIIRPAMAKLLEFSLAEFDDYSDSFTVHRWIQASRRLDLKDSGDERTVLRELLFRVPDMGQKENTLHIWQHVADNADLIKEFYTKKRTLTEFPLDDIDTLEKIIRGLSQIAGVEKFENYSDDSNYIICHMIKLFNLDAVERLVNAFNYNVRKRSTELISAAICSRNLNVIEWLVNEKACIPEERHLYECFRRVEITQIIPSFLKTLRLLKVNFDQIIEKNRGKNLFECLLHSELNNLESLGMDSASRCIEIIEIIRVMLSALRKLEPSNELNEITEKYSEKKLLECLLICGGPHEHMRVANTRMKNGEENWNDLHLAASENDLTAINSTDPTLIDSKTKCGMTPLMFAAQNGSREATMLLLLKYRANINAMDSNGYTPLIYAIKNGRLSIVKILISHGARTCWKTKFGVSVNALHEAVKSSIDYDSPELTQLVSAVLASKDCEVNATDRDGNNVLHMIAQHYYATRYKPSHRVLQLILQVNAALVKMQNNDGLTPQQLANNFLARFTDDHWHAKSLKNFISELDQKNTADRIRKIIPRWRSFGASDKKKTRETWKNL